MLQQRPQVRG